MKGIALLRGVIISLELGQNPSGHLGEGGSGHEQAGHPLVRLNLPPIGSCAAERDGVSRAAHEKSRLGCVRAGELGESSLVGVVEGERRVQQQVRSLVSEGRAPAADSRNRGWVVVPGGFGQLSIQRHARPDTGSKLRYAEHLSWQFGIRIQVGAEMLFDESFDVDRGIGRRRFQAGRGQLAIDERLDLGLFDPEALGPVRSPIPEHSSCPTSCG